MSQGRPKLFPKGRQLSVLVPPEDYEVLSATVEKARVERPGYSYGDLLRSYIRRCLAADPRRRRRRASADPKEDVARRLHATARILHRLAKEFENGASQA